MTSIFYEKKRGIDMSIWCQKDRRFSKEEDENIIAWAEMPEPYKDESNKD